MSSTYKPGIHSSVNVNLIDLTEREIMNMFSRNWKVTALEKNSKYDSCSFLINPSPKLRQLFNFNREIMVWISPFKEFDHKGIDDMKWSYFRWNNNTTRVEEVFCILVSKDPEVENKLKTLVKSQEGDSIIIPFTYKEIFTFGDKSKYLIDRLKNYLFSRDLFGFNNPISKESYLFGRNDLILKLVSKHNSSENSGIFGLRKIGKTSILIGVERYLRQQKQASIIIDCEALSFNSWNEAVESVIYQLKKKYGVKDSKLSPRNNYKEKSLVTESFKYDIKQILSVSKRKNVLIIFDEIEHITFETSSEINWREGTDFIKFWKVIRSSYHSLKGSFTYMVAGTNPTCIEKPSINNSDNPIFIQNNPEYVTKFTVEQTSKMVNTLGGYVGIYFDGIVTAKLTEDFGGHPFLMRKVCSIIHQSFKGERPVTIDKNTYQKYKKKFIKEEGFIYAEQILDVLQRFYPNEYIMMEYLSTGNLEAFHLFANDDPSYTYHLLNYGILSRNDEEYYFNTDLLKDYLASKNKYKRINLSLEEKQIEINKRRNTAETKLRRVVRNQLKMFHGETKAKEIVLKKWGSDRRKSKKYNKYKNLSLKDLFDSSKHEIYFDDLREIIRLNYEIGFSNLFEVSVLIFDSKMRLINDLRRVDCHATNISEADLMTFRGAMTWLEEKIEKMY